MPLTGKHVVDLAITNLGVFEVTRGEGMRLIELAPDVTLDDVKQQTEATFDVAV